MKIKKILALIMTFLMFFSSIKISASSTDSLDKEELISKSAISSSCSKLPWPIAIIVGSMLCVIAGYTGYKLGSYYHDNKNNPKMITLEGTSSPDTFVAPPNGEHRFELLAINYIDRLITTEIPKLKASNQFPARYLTNISWIFSSVPVDLNTIYENDKIIKAHDLSIRLRDRDFELARIAEDEKTITLEYLINILNDTKSLLQGAAELIDQKWYS